MTSVDSAGFSTLTRSDRARTAKQWHDVLGDYFAALPPFEGDAAGWDLADRPTTRRAEELPYHLVEARLWDNVERELCDVYFVETVARTGRKAVDSLAEQYDRACKLLDADGEVVARRERYRGEDGLVHWTAAARKEELERIRKHPTRNDKLRDFRNFMRSEKHRLLEHGETRGYTVQLACNRAQEGPVAQAASELLPQCKAPMLLVRPAFRPPFVADPPLLHVMAEHQDWLSGVLLTPDEQRAVSWSKDGRLRVWDLRSGKRVSVLAGHRGEVREARLFAKGSKLLSWDSAGDLRIWDTKTWACLHVLRGHTDRVEGAILYANESRVVSWQNHRYHESHNLRVWDVNTGDCVSVFEDAASRYLYLLHLLGDGPRFLARTYDIDSDEPRLRIGSLDTGQWLGELEGPHRGFRPVLRLVDGGTRALSSTEQSAPRLWDLDEAKCLHVFEGHADGDVAVKLYAAGTRAISYSDKTLRTWDLKTGRCLQVLQGSFGCVRTYANDTKLLSYSGNDLCIWDLDSGECLHVLEGHTCQVKDALLYANSTRILTRSWFFDYTLRVWDAETGVCLRVLEGHVQKVHGMRLDSNERRALSWSSDDTVRLWDLETGECLQVFTGHADTVSGAQLFDGETRMLSWCRWTGDSTLRVWDVEAEGRTHLPDTTLGFVYFAKTYANGRHLLADGGGALRIWDTETAACLHTMPDLQEPQMLTNPPRVLGETDQGIEVWDPETGRRVHQLKGVGERCFGLPGYGEIYAKQTRLLALAKKGELRVHSLESGECLHVIDGHAGRVKHVWRFTREGEHMVLVWDEDEALRLWSLDTGRRHHVLRGHSRGRGILRTVRLCANNTRAISFGTDDTLRTWCLETGACLNATMITGHRLQLGAVHVLSSGKRALSMSGGWVPGEDARLWDLETGECLRVLESCSPRDNTAAQAARICANDSRLVTFNEQWHRHFKGTVSGTIRVWDLESGECLLNLEGHPRSVASIKLFANDTRLISWGEHENTARIWNLETGQCLHLLEGHRPIDKCRLYANDTRLLTWSDDGVRHWDLDTGSCLHVLKARGVQVYEDEARLLSWNPVRLWDLETGRCLMVADELSPVTAPTSSVLPVKSSGLQLLVADLTGAGCGTPTFDPEPPQ